MFAPGEPEHKQRCTVCQKTEIAVGVGVSRVCESVDRIHDKGIHPNPIGLLSPAYRIISVAALCNVILTSLVGGGGRW